MTNSVSGRLTIIRRQTREAPLILNQISDWSRARPGHGRVFIGLDDDQGEPLRQHIATTGIHVTRWDWGRPTLVIKDLDDNELFFWLPHDDFTGFEVAAALEPSRVTGV